MLGLSSVSSKSSKNRWCSATDIRGLTTAGADRQTQEQRELLEMSDRKRAKEADTFGTEISRFNALRHGVLSGYTVLPWENAAEYHALVAALVAEHAPQGPTEEHLVEEVAGILWRKRRLRLAEAAADRTTAGADRQTQEQRELLGMSDRKSAKRAETGGTEITRFNALRHGLLSRYT